MHLLWNRRRPRSYRLTGSSPWDSPGKNTEVGCHAIPFSRESSRPRDRIHISYISCTGKQILYCLSHQGSPGSRYINRFRPSVLGHQDFSWTWKTSTYALNCRRGNRSSEKWKCLPHPHSSSVVWRGLEFNSWLPAQGTPQNSWALPASFFHSTFSPPPFWKKHDADAASKFPGCFSDSRLLLKPRTLSGGPLCHVL